MSSNNTTPTTDPGTVPDFQDRPAREPNRPSAREVDDPHDLSDTGPGILERIAPQTAGQWIGAVATALILLGLTWYLLPFISSLAASPWFWIGGTALTVLSGTYVVGRIHGLGVLKRMDMSIIYYGDDADVRLCKDSDVEGRTTTVTPITGFRLAGLRSRTLKLADLPFDSRRLKAKLDGYSNPEEQPVRDRLNQSTVTVQNDTLGTVHVTHASDMTYDAFGRHTDRYAEPPRRIDEDVADDFRLQLEDLQQDLRHHRQRIEALREANAEARKLKDQQTVPQLEQMMTLLEDTLQMIDRGKTGEGDEKPNVEIHTDDRTNGRGR